VTLLDLDTQISAGPVGNDQANGDPARATPEVDQPHARSKSDASEQLYVSPGGVDEVVVVEPKWPATLAYLRRRKRNGRLHPSNKLLAHETQTLATSHRTVLFSRKSQPVEKLHPLAGSMIESVSRQDHLAAISGKSSSESGIGEEDAQLALQLTRIGVGRDQVAKDL